MIKGSAKSLNYGWSLYERGTCYRELKCSIHYLHVHSKPRNLCIVSHLYEDLMETFCLKHFIRIENNCFICLGTAPPKDMFCYFQEYCQIEFQKYP